MAKEQGYPMEFYVLIFTSVTVFISVETTRPILPLLVTQIGASPLELGLVIGLLSFALMFAKMPLGAFSEVIPARNVLGIAAGGQSLVQWMYSVAPTPQAFYPIQIIHAITIAPLVPVAVAVSQNLAPDGRRSETMGAYLTSYGIASMSGSFLCSFLLTALDFAQIFQVAAVVPLIGLTAMIFARNGEYLQKPTGGVNRPSLSSSVRSILTSRDMLLLSYLRLAYSITFAFFVTFFVVYAESSLLIPATLVAFLFGVRSASDMIVRLPVGRMLNNYGYRRFIVAAFVTLAVVYYLISEITQFTTLLVLMAVFGAMIGLRVVSEYTMLAEHSVRGARSVYAAYLSTMFNIGSGFGSVLAGILASVLGIPAIFKIASALMITASVAALAIQGRIKS
jgi:predicted MFS family arabinose efflux permease